MTLHPGDRARPGERSWVMNDTHTPMSSLDHVMWVDGLGWRPRVSGGSDDGNPPPAPPTPPAPAPHGDLAALQAFADTAAATAAAEAQAAILAATGFDTPDALAEFVAAQRAAADAQLTEVERREAAATAATTTAEARAAEADALVRRGVINLALVRAGVAPANLDVASQLVALGDDLTDAAADAAVTAVKANPALASLFATATPPPPGGDTRANPPGGGGGTVTGIERGAELYAATHPTPKTA